MAARALVGLCAALLPFSAFADFLSMSGPQVTTISVQPLAEEYAIDFGTVCSNTAQSSQFQLQVTARSHSDPVGSAGLIFLDGSTVSVSLDSTSGSGFTASAPSPTSIVLPANWSTLPDGTLSPSVNSTITLNTSVVGAISGTAVYSVSGTNLNNGTLTKSTTLDVKANVVSCNTNTDVSVVKQAAKSSINAGETATFSIVVTNNGPATANNVTLSDNLRSGLTWSLGGADAAACGISGSVLSCNFGSISFPGSRTITVSAVTSASNCGTINNTAVVSATNDSNAANNSSSASITVNCKPSAQITPTNTTCQQFVSGTAATLAGFDYNLKNGAINNVAPGVAFYFVSVTAPASSFTVHIAQTDNGSTPPFDARQVQVFDATCNTYGNATSSISTGLVTVNITGATTGQQYIVLFKIDPHSVVDAAAPNPATVTYTYSTDVNGFAVAGSTQSIALEP